jgi:exodeoxyribonuclease-5
MLPRDMWLRLLSHHVYVLACGDPGQLPPIDKDSDNHVLDKPHVFLDEIMRQAYDSEIIRFSMWIREGKPINKFPVSNEQVMFVHKNDITTGMYKWADQILCATNAQRNSVNNYMREIMGFGAEPQVGDKIISLHNQWSFLSSDFNEEPLTNGSIGIIKSIQPSRYFLPKYISDKDVDILYTSMIDENGNKFEGIPIDYKYLTTGEKALTPQQEFKMRKGKNLPDPPFEFAYAYGITGHKAQGSEWSNVLAMEERFPFDKTEHARWCYTVATRASNKLVWQLT